MVFQLLLCVSEAAGCGTRLIGRLLFRLTAEAVVVAGFAGFSPIEFGRIQKISFECQKTKIWIQIDYDQINHQIRQTERAHL